MPDLFDKNQICDRRTVIERITEQIPRRLLAHFSTPLMRANRLTEMLGEAELWFKRDDLISFGLGGNKIRGLEVMLADALARQADWLVAGAGVQSNHVRATAAVAAHAELLCTAVFWGKPPAATDGNYRLTRMLEADIRFTGDDDRESVDHAIEQVAAELLEQGRRPYAIPRGGACLMGVLGHVLAVFELYHQCLAQNLQPDTIVLAVGSGGSYAGWLLGTRLLNLPWKLAGYTVSREPDQVSRQIARLAGGAAEFLQLALRFSEGDAPIRGGFIGQGYGIPSPEAARAIRLISRTEGILLDPTYTGKAMAGFLHGMQQEQLGGSRKIVFIHTGGEPAFFAGQGDWLSDGPK
jgi:D-cysteine desulfhydrase family pyridoxal phosphate-dependent enzyme